MSPEESRFEEEVMSWSGFAEVLRRDDRQAWDCMISNVKGRFAEAIERSGRTFTTDPFFMALVLLQQRMIGELRDELESIEREQSRLSEGDSAPD